ncbi:hypothetical protein GCM10011517_14340 [Actibacterium pelagium]|uniref:Medium/long-chain acyl-CoA thioesterase YigI n=1 Tax=Actibacterium pelagium TaxID=2029103 RepID=A0A917AEI5_9RHOB|nr:hotdog fold thioesterase [Actibacterium pelagium]GGE47652.1 hypothetical protein GCM10011517_14340 [Actibacterium pelagium]
MDTTIQAAVAKSFAGQGMIRALGMKLGNVDEGAVEIFLPNSDAVTQQHGFFHGGAIATLADDAAAFAAYTMMEDGRQPLTVEFKINFLAPAEGPQLRAIGTVLRSGRSVAHSRADVFAQAEGGEVLVATALATIKATRAVVEKELETPQQANFAPEGFFRIPGYENYAIDKGGRIYSKKKKNGFLKPWTEKNNGYQRVELRDNPERREKPFVHDLVLRTFKGNRPNFEYVARHLNDDPEDNRVENLEWGSRRQNSKDSLQNKGQPALSDGEKSQIAKLYKSGNTQTEIANKFGVSQRTISRIISGIS